MSKLARIIICISLVTIMLGAVMCKDNQVFAASSVSDSNQSFVEAVNLKKDSWTYSTKKDSRGQIYSVITKYSGDEISVEIPSELGGYPVRQIGSEAFSECKYLVAISFPESITDIGRYAFKDCIGIKSLNFPLSLKNIGNGAFYGCKSLRSVTMPNGLVKIGRHAFFNCWHLKSITMPNTLVEIGDYAFNGCSQLEKVKFNDKLERIGMYSFGGCTALIEVKLPNSLLSAGRASFSSCTSLKTVRIGDSLSRLESSIFRGCTALENVTFGVSVSEIGSSAFEKCTSINSVTLNDSVTNIDSMAFNNCLSLKNISLGSSLNKIGMALFNGCTSLKSVTVNENCTNYRSESGMLYTADGKTLIFCPQGISGTVAVSVNAEAISDYAFAGCHEISGINLHNNITSFGNGSFLNCCNITSLFLPMKLKDIRGSAVGHYLVNGKLASEPYLRVFGNDDSDVKTYCSSNKIKFIPYNQTFKSGADKIFIEKGKSFKMPVSFMTSYKANITSSVSDDNIVSVEKNSIIVGKEIGISEVTLSADGFEPINITVEVIDIKPENEYEPKIHETKKIYLGESFELSSTFDMILDPLLDKNDFWYSSNPSVAVVSQEGHVTSIGCGTALITCVSYSGSDESCTVIVSEKAEYFTIENEKTELALGSSMKLTAKLMPKKSDDLIIWKSSNDEIASVDSNGKITALSQGNCIITASAECGVSAEYELSTYIPLDELKLDLSERSIYQGKSFALDAIRTPAESKQTVKWRSSDSKVASVNSKGRVTGLSFGTADIYAETENGISSVCRVNVIAKAEKLGLDKKNLMLNVDDTHKLNALILPSYSPETTEKCEWSSTDSSTAEIDENGMIRAINEGSCIINCKIDGELISKCRLTVRRPAVSAEIISQKDNIYIGDVVVMKAKLVPDKSTDKVEWSSSNPDIAYITSTGSVKAKACGTATITLTVTNDVTGNIVTTSCEINVLSPAESIKLSRNNISLRVGENDSIIYSLSPSDSNDTVKWYSSDDSVAAVRIDGLITAMSEGSCYVYVETGSGKTARCKVTISK